MSFDQYSTSMELLNNRKTVRMTRSSSHSCYGTSWIDIGKNKITEIDFQFIFQEKYSWGIRAGVVSEKHTFKTNTCYQNKILVVRN